MRVLFLLCVALVTSGCAGLDRQTDHLAGTSWQLQAIQSMDDAQGTTRVPDKTYYTVSFGRDGRVAMRLDCNRATGSWRAEPASTSSGSLQFSALAMTRALCPPASLDTRIARDMPYVRSYVLKEGRLYFSLQADGGIYEWAPLTLGQVAR